MSDQENRRPVRSYVKREGRITEGQRHALKELWPKFGVEPQGLLDFKALFGREADTVLEIGFGNGDTLLQMAQAEPDSDFIGIEVYESGAGRLLANIDAEGLSNLRVIKHDAVEILRNNIPDQSLTRVMIFFPDPWPKKRHHKRRLIQPDFVSLLQSKLMLDGILHCATDWENYAEQMLDVLSLDKRLENTAGVGNYAKRPEYRPLTKFERRGQALGHGVWDLIYRKV